MPSAQGRMTVRRRPKNGDDGSDAIIYHFIPSVSSIVLQKDGTLRPSALSVRLVKNVGGQDIDMISQTFDGHTVLCHIKKSNGDTNFGYTPGASLPLSSSASATLLSIEFELVFSGKIVASLSVPCIPAGKDGEDVFLLDLDNEMQGIPCNSSGTPTVTGTLATTNSIVYRGSSVDPGWTFSKADTGCTSSIDASAGAVSVTAISADKAEVVVTATKGTKSLSATMSLYKVKAGANGTNGTNGTNGQSPVVYSIEVTASAISRDKNGNINPTSITAYKNKTVGNTTTHTTEKALFYQRIGQDSAPIEAVGASSAIIQNITSACTAVDLKLYDADRTTILDSERVPVVRDGQDGQNGTNGDDGTDGMTFVVSPSNIEFHYDKAKRVEVHIDVYRGSERLLYGTTDGYSCSALESTSGYTITEGLTWRFTVEESGGFYYTLIHASNHDVNIDIPFNITVGGVQYNRILCVKTIKDGADAERYWLVPNVLQITKAADGTLSQNSVSCNILKQVGDNTAEPTDDLFATWQYVYTNNLMSVAQRYTRNAEITVAATLKQIIFKLYRTGSVTAGAAIGSGAELDTVTVSLIADGKDGATGPQGIQGCIYRRSKFATGFEYHNDEALVSNGIRYIDLVYIMKDSTMFASHALWFKCRKTHSSTTDNAPQKTNNGTEPWLEYWEPLNPLEPIHTPFLMADDAVITLLQSNQIVVMKEDGSTVSAALGGGKYPFWIGDVDPLSGKFYIDDEGKVLSGTPDGQRIEIQPRNKAIKIFDSSGNESSSFEGRSYTSLSSLFGDTSGTFVMNDKKKGNVGLSGTNPAPVSEEYKVCSPVYSEAPVKVTVSGFLQTYCTKSSSGDLSAPDISIEGSSSGPGQLQNGVNSTISTNHSNASISLYVNTYSDSSLTNLLSSVQIASCRGDSSKTISNATAKTSAGGYHVLVVKVALSAVGSAQTAWAKWGSVVSGKADISGTYVSDFYVSRYFANGFCLGVSRSNYVWAYNQSSGGMRFVIENSGYGFDISNGGIKYKHHSGSWMNMPMLVFRGRAYNFNSSGSITYAWTGQSSFNASQPSLSRTAEGRIKVTFPDSWTNAGITPSSCSINVLGFGAVNGSSGNPVKAQIYEIINNYVTISLSDDASENDGSFIIQIFTT